MGYIGKKLRYICKTMGNIRKNYGLYWSVGYIRQKLRDILGKIMGYIPQNYGIYYGIYWAKTMIYLKNYGKYSEKLWVILVSWIY